MPKMSDNFRALHYNVIINQAGDGLRHKAAMSGFIRILPIMGQSPLSSIGSIKKIMVASAILNASLKFNQLMSNWNRCRTRFA